MKYTPKTGKPTTTKANVKMAKIVRHLTQKQIEASHKKANNRPEKRNDGNNLSLLVSKTGHRAWVSRYEINGTFKEWRFATYPACSAKQARQLNEEYQALAKQGIDPKKANNADKEAKQLTFENVAIEMLALRKKENRNDKENIRRLEKHAYPVIGNMPHHEITKEVIQNQIIDPLISKGVIAEATKVRQIIKTVFSYAIKRYEKIQRNPADNLMLPKYKAKPYHAITEENDLKPFLIDVWQYREKHPQASIQVDGLIKLAIMFFLRPSEIRCLKWTDYNEQEQIIDAYSSKVDIKHPIMLPKQAIEILQTLKEHKIADNEYIFASNQSNCINKPLSEATYRKALEKMGYKGVQTMHGLRATVRTIADEELGLHVDYLESQLTHQAKDPLKGSYNRSSYKRQRGHILQKWADYIEALRLGENVERFKFDYEPTPTDTLKELIKLLGKDEIKKLLSD